METRERIDKYYLVKAEILLADAIGEAKKNDDNELAKAIAEACGKLCSVRPMCWPNND